MSDEPSKFKKEELTPPQQITPNDLTAGSGPDPWIIKPMEEMVTRLNFALSSTLLYPIGHPVVNETTEKIYHILNSLLETYSSIMLQFYEEDVIYRGEPLLESSFLVRQLSGHFSERGIGSITFERGIGHEEILSLVYSFHQSGKNNVLTLDALQQILMERNVVHITLGPPIGTAPKTATHPVGTKYDYAKEIYNTGTKLVESVALSAVSQRVIDVGIVRPIVQDLIDNLSEDNSALLAVSSLKSFDNYLFTHSMNVCILSLSLSMFMNMEPDRLLEVGIGALLHDIGKVYVPPEIIHKPAKLTEAEWDVIKRHPVEGLKMILRSRYATELTALIVYAHHWKFASDEGYPQTRRKFKRSPFVSLVTVCDCYDAMTTNRPYNRIHLPSDALSIIKQLSGMAFDPQIVYFFSKMLGPYPIGTLVKLNTGEIGIVLKIHPEEIERPQVKLIINQDGEKIDDIFLLDLSEKDDSDKEYLYSIREIVDPTKVTFNVWEYL